MIKREEYLKKLIQGKDKDIIKVLSGIRGAGKSSLLALYRYYLTRHGVKKEQLISVDLEQPEFGFIQSGKDLYDYVNGKMVENQQNYVFLEEVQGLKSFQKCVMALYMRKNVDVYLASSRADLLSGKWMTFLEGRYVEIEMLPLSFQEYVQHMGEVDGEQKYWNYRENSAFPYALRFKSKKEINTYLQGLYHTILVKDVVANRRLADFEMLEDVLKFTFENMGNLYSMTQMAHALEGQRQEGLGSDG